MLKLASAAAIKHPAARFHPQRTVRQPNRGYDSNAPSPCIFQLNFLAGKQILDQNLFILYFNKPFAGSIKLNTLCPN